MSSFTIRQAHKNDTPKILLFIKKILEYSKVTDKVTITEEQLEVLLFGNGNAEVIFAVVDGNEVGFALYTVNSSFVGHSCLYLEDIFVLPEMRGKGYGKALFQYLAQLAVDYHYDCISWKCLKSNQLGLGFYYSLGAVVQDEWYNFSLVGDSLKNVAKSNQISRQDSRG